MSAARGACPTLAAPMATGDGLLARLNPLSGGIAPLALAGLAEAAARHGNGLLEVTSRGSIQVRGLTETSAAALAVEVDALGIAVRDGVPVDVSPLAGIDATERADAGALADGLRVRIAAAELADRLGPKVSVVADGGGAIGLGALIADVRIVAVDEHRWHVATGGTAQTARSVGSGDAGEAATAALAILSMLAELGTSARARDLSMADLANVAPSLDALSLPTRETDVALPIGTLALRAGPSARGYAVALGQIDAARLARFANVAASLGASDIRPSPGRGLLILGVAERQLPLLDEAARDAGLITDPVDPLSRITACAGAPLCGSAHLSTHEVARSLAPHLAATTRLHVSGCGKRCAAPAGVATIVGTADGACLELPSAKPVELARVGHVLDDDAFARVVRALDGHSDRDRAARRRTKEHA